MVGVERSQNCPHTEGPSPCATMDYPGLFKPAGTSDGRLPLASGLPFPILPAQGADWLLWCSQSLSLS